MDQSIVIIISNILVLIAALGGAWMGAFLTNRYALGQDKRRKKIEVIEELYELALRVRAEVDAYLVKGPYAELPSGVSDSLLGLCVLTDLYIHSLSAKATQLSDCISSLEAAHKGEYAGTDELGSPVPVPAKTAELDQAKDAYMRSYGDLIKALQDLGKGSIDST